MEKALLHDVAQYYKFDVNSAETEYQMYLSGTLGKSNEMSNACNMERSGKESSPKSNIAKEIEKARAKIKSLNTPSSGAAVSLGGDGGQFEDLHRENKELRSLVEKLSLRVEKLEATVSKLTGTAHVLPETKVITENGGDAPDDEDDDDIDLFGSDDEETKAEQERLKEERLKAYQEKKAKKPALIAKSNIILDVKPWDDETDMAQMERHVRSIEKDGLLWGSAKLVPVGYGIKKLQISCVVEDDKVGVDDLEEEITAFEDFVQSVDVVAFNKI